MLQNHIAIAFFIKLQILLRSTVLFSLVFFFDFPDKQARILSVEFSQESVISQNQTCLNHATNRKLHV